jgi:glycosyltransferase involved in cell wall biosynthesis
MSEMKLSIITINRNNAEGLRKTMESVFAQTCRDFEYIVVDGASTDGSVEVISDYVQKAESQDPRVNSFLWLSEPDTGIYNAMNKGVRMASGEYTLMLNSADFLVDEHVIERIIPELHTEDMIQGNIIVESEGKMFRNHSYGCSEISFFDVLDMRFLHQSIFIRRSIVEQYGYYDESYQLTSDSYFFIKTLGFGNATFRYIDMDIANFDMHGVSGSQSHKWQQIAEQEKDRWFSEHVSCRLIDLYQNAPKKIRLYDKLHSHRIVWYMVMALIRIAEKIHPTHKVISLENIGNPLK